MKTLKQAIADHAGQAAPALLKHLALSGIGDWGDLTKANLSDFRDALGERVAASSAKTYIATLKALMGRYEDEGVFPCKDFRTVLHAKNDSPVKTYLTKDELDRLERMPVKNDNEKFVLYSFLVGAYTGMRVSDVREVSGENIEDGMLTYVSIKTGVHATVPCSERTEGYIRWLRENDSDITLAGYNNIIRRLCRRAGINERVKVRHGGRDMIKEKWECVSSHTARISAATNLAVAGTPLCDIRQILGHTNEQMTSRYVASHKVKLNDRAMAYFGR